MRKKSILFIHKLIFNYRLSFYDRIATIPEYDITVLHSGNPMKTEGSNFQEIIVPEISLKGLLWQKFILKTAKSADIVIALFDVHYISTIFLALLPHKFKLIFWGIGFGRSSLANYVRIYLSKRADALALYMPRNIENFIINGVPKQKVFCAPNTIHVENPIFNENYNEKNCFLFLGSLKPRKKVEDVLFAFKKALPKFTRKISIDIIGNGEMMPKLNDIMENLGLQGRVKFHGSINENEKLLPFFNRALAIISPGQAGLTILHGFAHGIPMVTSRYAISGGEMENIIDGKNGILYDGTVKELSDILVNLANYPEYAKLLGQNAYEYYNKNMTLDHLISSFQNIIYYVQKTADD